MCGESQEPHVVRCVCRVHCSDQGAVCVAVSEEPCVLVRCVCRVHCGEQGDMCVAVTKELCALQ